MRTRMSRNTLLQTLQENLEEHVRIYEEAIDGWKNDVRGTIEDALVQHNQGVDLPNYVTLPKKPINHKRDYDRVISMVDRSTVDIDLDEKDFSRYVLDEWDWKDEWVGTTSNYTSSRP